MQIILSKQCESFTGSLGKRFGYHIQKRKNGFFAKRNTKGFIPHDGHWRFIFACAQIAQRKCYFTDIRVPGSELQNALIEAGYFVAAQNLRKLSYNTQDIINLKATFSL